MILETDRSALLVTCVPVHALRVLVGREEDHGRILDMLRDGGALDRGRGTRDADMGETRYSIHIYQTYFFAIPCLDTSASCLKG